MDTAPLHRYIARVWEGEEELHADPFFQEEYKRDIVAFLIYVVGLRYFSTVTAKVIEHLLLRHFPRTANDWVCRAEGSQYHQLDKYQIFWIAIGVWLPFALRENPLLRRRRHHYELFLSCFAVISLGEVFVVLILSAVALYNHIGDMMKKKSSTPKLHTPEPDETYSGSFILDYSVWLEKRRWLARYTSTTSPITEPKTGSMEPHTNSQLNLQKQKILNLQRQEIATAPLPRPTTVNEVLQAVTAEPGLQHLSFEELRMSYQDEMRSINGAPENTPLSPMELSHDTRPDTNWLRVRRFADSTFSTSTMSTDSRDSFGKATPAREGMIAEMSKKNDSLEVLRLLTGSGEAE